MPAVLRSVSLLSLCGLLGASSACGWFAGAPPTTSPPATEDPAALRPTCRPAEAVVKRGELPWTTGMTTGAGWQVAAITPQEVTDPGHWPEYTRVSFKKDAVETAVEIAYNDAGPGDWSTQSYRLMPAPDQTPPDDLLQDVIATLRTWDAAHADAPFVGKRAGVTDPYEGLPPCAPGEAPL